MQDVALYLTIDGSPTHAFMAERCLRSIRRFNRAVPVHLFVYGAVGRSLARAARAARVTLVQEPPRAPGEGTFLKWLPLDVIDAQRALYLDADTVCGADPCALFETYAERDFYARIECGTRGRRSALIGTFIIHPQVSWPALGLLRRALGARPTPVFNTGVMVFNHGAHQRLAPYAAMMLDLREGWASGDLPFPCTNPHIQEEVAATIALGLVPRLRVGSIRRADSPWFIELLAGEATSPGAVLHVWSKYYPHFLEREEGPQARARFDALSAQAPSPA